MTTDDVEEIANCECTKDTIRACLVTVPVAGSRSTIKVWVPKSLIHDDSEVYKEGTKGTLVVARWFAEKEGLG